MTRAVRTVAEVQASDGQSYTAESYFQAADRAAIRFVDANEQLFVVEGPWGWAAQDGAAQLGPNLYRVFALGHQYHALLAYFDEIIAEKRHNENVEFGGGLYSTISGPFPFGGTVHMVSGKTPDKPEGMLFEFSEAPKIESRFLDWRTVEERLIPFHIEIHDGQSVFNYKYSLVDFSPMPEQWFSEAIPLPEINEVIDYRRNSASSVDNCGEPSTEK
ncbi:MAG: hypothetical protein OEZ11_06315 [Gammaproteobacteria bacterium]|nr:hypothetical protein [Gammaproteobacteria bacterium]